MKLPPGLEELLRETGQGHVLGWLQNASEQQRQALVSQIAKIDLRQLRQLFVDQDKTYAVPASDRIQPIPVRQVDTSNREILKLGESALTRGEVAALLVAGGQGTRLGFDHPKGMFPIGPVSGKSLFQLHAEKVLALSRRYRSPIPLLVMTSPATHDETVRYFQQEAYFGLPPAQAHFFQQGTMPALDMATGGLLREAIDQLCTSPNGHGGTLPALVESGLLEKLTKDGIKMVFYCQVDNPLVRICDPWLLGYHLQADAQVSAKVVPKESPTDKLGNLVLVDGRCGMIEYSDLPESLATQTEPDGRLRIWAGSPAIHAFSIDFLTRLTDGRLRIPFHIARKKVPYLNEMGQLVRPEKENALKLEMFIFDVLPLADRWVIVETSRASEFMPLKNATGADSPETVKQAMSNLAGSWLESAGARVPRAENGDVAVRLEIGPLFALDAEELQAKLPAGLMITEDRILA